MNRLQFIGQTHQGKMVSIDDIINYFDHTMAAYEVVENVEDVNVSGNIDTIHSSMKIVVESPHESELQEVVEYLNTIHNRKDIYGRSFCIEASLNGKFVELFVREIPSYQMT